MREAESEEVLIRDLNRDELYPVKIAQDTRRTGGLRSQRRFSKKTVLELVSTLSVLLSSGLTFKDALEIMQSIYPSGEINTISVLLLESVSKGRMVSQAVDELHYRLPAMVRGFIRIGEKTGSMDASIAQLAVFLTEQTKLRTKIQTSLIYPVFVLCVAAVGITGIVLFVFPRIRMMFSELGSVMPGRMQAIMSILDVGVPVMAVLFLVLLLTYPLYRLVIRGHSGIAERFGRFILRMPVIGKYAGLKENVNFLFAMESLVAGGFTVEEALAESKPAVGNPAVKDAITDVRNRVIKGDSIARAFAVNPVFADRIGRWCAIGERTGSVEAVFSQLRNYYQSELEKQNTRVMNVIEPFLILVVGIIVFIVVFFLVVPLFSLYESMM
ncbi:MAG: type II secretion system F family protein [Spirochaetales bacterium]|nr:type II secretion system F family protein [Spirochaetales bacterium]